MQTFPPSLSRDLQEISLQADLVVIGGGLAGVTAAITAAREGLRVILVQDRPVLGGNASSEVRLWALGATSHMGNNNRWAREGGVMDEIAVENLWRNREGNPIFMDVVLLEMTVAESNITLLLNTAVFEVGKSSPEKISEVRAFCSQNSTLYTIRAPLFCDASGDGVVGFLSGSAFRIGAESASEFGEPLAPNQSFGELLGHSIYFYSKDIGRPVTFVPPAFALYDLGEIPKFRSFNARSQGCSFWWIEYGGRLDTVHDTEAIKWELWKVVYGVWNHIKNSGLYPEAETMTLEWLGTIPGKRESRRFEGDHLLSQADLVEQRLHADAVSYGGWAIDLHPADGIYSKQSPCTQFHGKGVYQIPYRCLYSRNIANLFLAGRTISASHVAFGSTRVMMTCAHNSQVVGVAAALCLQEKIRPRDLLAPNQMRALQTRLLRTGQFIPNVALEDEDDIASVATITASSSREISQLAPGSDIAEMDRARALLLPLPAGRIPTITFLVFAKEPADLRWELRSSSKIGNYTPDRVLASHCNRVEAGAFLPVSLAFDVALEQAQYVFVCLMPVPGVKLALSDERLTGVLTVAKGQNKHVAENSAQEAPPGSGLESFEFWLPERRPGGKNLAATFVPPLQPYSPGAVAQGYERPFISTEAWCADPSDPRPFLDLCWDSPRQIARVILSFDTDFDHPLETAQWGHPERITPFCVKRFRLLDDHDRVLFEAAENHQTRRTIVLPLAVETARLRLEFPEPEPGRTALFRIRIFES
jgi:hypothetical protein